VPIDFTLTPEQLRLRGDARAFARDVLSKVESATRELLTPLGRFAATRPFYEQTVRAGFLRRLIPASLGGQGTGIVDMVVLAEEFAVDVNISLTLLGTMLGLFPVLLGGTPEQAARFFAPFAVGQGAPLAAFAVSEPGGSANFAAPAPAEGVRTQARLEGDHWVISGAKKWVSSGTGWDGKGADLLTVVCSTDPEQEFFADGIAEDVITALSRYPSLFVIARNSSFTYKGRAIDVKEIGRELGVRYVLEGSLRKAANRIRVTAQLVEAETGKHVWAERYDRDLADIFAVQDEITQATTIAVAPAIADAEQQRDDAQTARKS
jgi:TolB-like protein